VVAREPLLGHVINVFRVAGDSLLYVSDTWHLMKLHPVTGRVLQLVDMREWALLSVEPTPPDKARKVLLGPARASVSAQLPDLRFLVMFDMEAMQEDFDLTERLRAACSAHFGSFGATAVLCCPRGRLWSCGALPPLYWTVGC
jgi:hypothetical protein